MGALVLLLVAGLALGKTGAQGSTATAVGESSASTRPGPFSGVRNADGALVFAARPGDFGVSGFNAENAVPARQLEPSAAGSPGVVGPGAGITPVTDFDSVDLSGLNFGLGGLF